MPAERKPLALPTYKEYVATRIAARIRSHRPDLDEEELVGLIVEELRDIPPTSNESRELIEEVERDADVEEDDADAEQSREETHMHEIERSLSRAENTLPGDWIPPRNRNMENGCWGMDGLTPQEHAAEYGLSDEGIDAICEQCYRYGRHYYCGVKDDG